MQIFFIDNIRELIFKGPSRRKSLRPSNNKNFIIHSFTQFMFQRFVWIWRIRVPRGGRPSPLQLRMRVTPASEIFMPL
jgi:hypothetical protein